MKLKDQIAVVMGIENELGKVIALTLAKEGAKIVACGSKYQSSKEVSIQINHFGGKAIALKCNPLKTKDIQDMIKQTIQKFEKIDIFIDCFDLFLQKSISKTSEKEWNKVINSNLSSSFLSVKEISKHLIKNKKGKIIFISSIFGKVGLKNASAYSTVCGGIDNLTKELALELSPHNINVNCISPGIISTRAGNMFDLNDKEVKNNLLSNIPMRRFGTPEEVADAVVFLASNDANFITGHNLVVDGGWLAH